jgi:hypothetical protein
MSSRNTAATEVRHWTTSGSSLTYAIYWRLFRIPIINKHRETYKTKHVSLYYVGILVQHPILNLRTNPCRWSATGQCSHSHLLVTAVDRCVIRKKHFWTEFIHTNMDINMETWSSRFGVARGADDPTLKKSRVRKPKMWPRNSQIDCRDDWEKSIKEVKVRNGL